MRNERDNFPVIVASPSSGIVRTKPCEEDKENIIFDLDRMYLDGKVEYARKQKNPFEGLLSFRKNRAIKHKRRNQFDAMIQRKAGLVPEL